MEQLNLRAQQIIISSPKDAFVCTKPLVTLIPPKAVKPKSCFQTSLAEIHAAPAEFE